MLRGPRRRGLCSSHVPPCCQPNTTLCSLIGLGFSGPLSLQIWAPIPSNGQSKLTHSQEGMSKTSYVADAGTNECPCRSWLVFWSLRLAIRSAYHFEASSLRGRSPFRLPIFLELMIKMPSLPWVAVKTQVPRLLLWAGALGPPKGQHVLLFPVQLPRHFRFSGTSLPSFLAN